MLHPRKDYARIQDPAGLIPKNEPVFLLRAQDQIAPMAVRYWADRNEHAGGDPILSQKARDHADKMERWPVKKLADLPAEPQGDVVEQEPGGPAEAEQQQIENLKQEATDQPIFTDEQKQEIINEHINHLPENITTRDQAIASADLFSADIKAGLSIAFGCSYDKVPETVADHLGFTAAESENRPGAGIS